MPFFIQIGLPFSNQKTFFHMKCKKNLQMDIFAISSNRKMAFAAAETYFVVVSSSSDNTVGNILIIFFTLLLFGRVGFE